jgi:hypothetical protein
MLNYYVVGCGNVTSYKRQFYDSESCYINSKLALLHKELEKEYENIQSVISSCDFY